MKYVKYTLAIITFIFSLSLNAKEQIALEVVSYLDGKNLSTARIITTNGSPAEIALGQLARLVIYSNAKDENTTQLDMELYLSTDESAEIVAEPKISTENSKMATVEYQQKQGSPIFKFEITPSIVDITSK